MKQGCRALQFILHHYGHMSSENAELEAKQKKTKVELYSEVIL